MASRSSARQYTGSICPLAMRFDYIHGTSPASGSVTLPGNLELPVAKPAWMQVGNSIWQGFILDSRASSESITTSVSMADWRDGLHDTHIRAVFNMQEDDGRVYHILPDDWQFQRRTYVSRELDQLDFFAVQVFAGDIVRKELAKNLVYSAWALLLKMAVIKEFELSADEAVENILRTTYPMNLDWNSGARFIDAIQQICEKAGVQMCWIGTKTLYLTIRGFATNPFLQAFLDGHLSYCSLGAANAVVGDQLSDKGRRIVVQGDRNRREYVFACKANWNPMWDFPLSYNGFALGALLESLGLTYLNKLKEMPKLYWDEETWTEANDLRGKGAATLKRKRTEMTIGEYVEKIVGKCYVIDFRHVAKDFKPVTDGPLLGTVNVIDPALLNFTGETIDFSIYNRFPSFLLDSSVQDSQWPISSRLPSESNLQYLAYSTSRKVVQGVENPFYHQLSFVPKLEGASLDVEEILNADGVARWRCRIFFNETQVHIPPGMDFENVKLFQPDMVLVRLSLDTDMFVHVQGDMGNAPRLREQKISVPNLASAYVNNEEISFLANNFATDLGDAGVAPALKPVKASDIAKQIATQLLFRKAIVRSGNLVFQDRAGTIPDGIIESVSVSWNEGDVEEIVNFGNEIEGKREVIPPAVLRMAYKFLDETELNRRRLLWAAKIALAEERAAAGRAAPVDHEIDTFAGKLAPHKVWSNFDKDGVVAIKYDSAYFEENLYVPGDIIMVRGAVQSGLAS